MPKIWAGGASANSSRSLDRLMVEDDITVDRHLVRYEILVLLAYHIQIYREKIIPETESSRICSVLLDLYRAQPPLIAELEDVHGNVESAVLQKDRTAGGNLRIFLSRNEQSHSNIVLFRKERYLSIAKKCIEISSIITSRLDDFRGILPGYTHYRQAMPITSATYMDYAASIFLEESMRFLHAADGEGIFPFGYGSGFGSPIGVDADKIAQFFGMKHPPGNPIYYASNRGIEEADMLYSLSHLLIRISRLMQDLIVLSGDEAPIFRLPDGFTTGSSLMANKNNPDFLEMIQGYAGEMVGRLNASMTIAMNKSTGYHRDFQISKKLAIESVVLTEEILDRLCEFFASLELNPETAANVLQNAAYTTSNAVSLFRRGLSWKEAYAEAGRRVREGVILDEIPPGDRISTDEEKIAEARDMIAKAITSFEEHVTNIIKQVERIAQIKQS